MSATDGGDDGGGDTVLIAVPERTVRAMLALASVSRSLLSLAPVSGALRRLARVARPLEAFIRNPYRFIMGVVVVGLLAMLERGTIAILDGIIRILGGSQPYSTPETEASRGLADAPILIVRPALEALGVVGERITGSLNELQQIIFEAATVAGPLAPVVHVALWGSITVLTLLALRRVLLAVTDLIPGGGELLTLITGNR